MAQVKHLRAQIVSRQDYAADLWSVRIAPEQPIAFKPGQYATLGLVENGKLLERPYSIVSSPMEPEIEFFFELVPNGILTPNLHRLQTGADLLVRPACKGLFTLDRKSGHTKHLLVATVTGVAPYVSMVRTLAADSPSTTEAAIELFVIQGASRSWEFAYAGELQELAGRHRWLRYIPTVSRVWEDPEWRGERGRADDVVRKYADQFGLTPENTTAYLCGHPTMIENVRGILRRAGFAKESIKEEVYFVLKGAGGAT